MNHFAKRFRLLVFASVSLVPAMVHADEQDFGAAIFLLCDSGANTVRSAIAPTDELRDWIRIQIKNQRARDLLTAMSQKSRSEAAQLMKKAMKKVYKTDCPLLSMDEFHDALSQKKNEASQTKEAPTKATLRKQTTSTKETAISPSVIVTIHFAKVNRYKYSGKSWDKGTFETKETVEVLQAVKQGMHATAEISAEEQEMVNLAANLGVAFFGGAAAPDVAGTAHVVDESTGHADHTPLFKVENSDQPGWNQSIYGVPLTSTTKLRFELVDKDVMFDDELATFFVHNRYLQEAFKSKRPIKVPVETATRGAVEFVVISVRDGR